MKKGWERYASEKRYVQKGYLRKHSDGGSGRKALEASRSDRLQQSRKEQKEVVIQLYDKVVLPTEDVIHVGDQNESCREEDVVKTHQEGRQGVQKSDQGRCEAKETNTYKIKGEKMKKQSAKEKKHEAKETKAYEKKEDKKESKSKKK